MMMNRFVNRLLNRYMNRYSIPWSISRHYFCEVHGGAAQNKTRSSGFWWSLVRYYELRILSAAQWFPAPAYAGSNLPLSNGQRFCVPAFLAG